MYASTSINKPVFSKANLLILAISIITEFLYLTERNEPTCYSLCIFISAFEMKQGRGQEELFHKEI